MAEQGLNNTKASKVREESKGFLFKVDFFFLLFPVKIEQVLNMLMLEMGERMAFWKRSGKGDMMRLGRTLPEASTNGDSFLKCFSFRQSTKMQNPISTMHLTS